jgi:predicted membrane chloride channel (bestrophin family)
MIEYDAHDWRTHLFDIRGSMVVEIMGRVLTCVVWSACVVAFYHFVYPFSVPSTVHGLVGVALGLLLVFGPMLPTTASGRADGSGAGSSTRRATSPGPPARC